MYQYFSQNEQLLNEYLFLAGVHQEGDGPIPAKIEFHIAQTFQLPPQASFLPLHLHLQADILHQVYMPSE